MHIFRTGNLCVRIFYCVFTVLILGKLHTISCYLCTCLVVVLTKEPKKGSIQDTHQNHEDKKCDKQWGFWNFLCFKNSPTRGDDDDDNLVSS